MSADSQGETPGTTPEPFKRFEDLARKIVRVPKKDIEKQAEAEGRDKNGKRRRKS